MTQPPRTRLRPFSIRFSPDGGRLAVGFADSTRIDVLSGRDLEPVYSSDTRGIHNGAIGPVAWSSDGRFLYAGGTYHKESSSPILRWKDAGRGERSELAAASQTVMHLVSLKSRGVAFGTFDPAFGIIDPSGQKRLFHTAAIANFRNTGEGFRVSQDGATVQFGFVPWGRSPARFSVNQRLIETGPAGGGLSPPLTRAEGLAFWMARTARSASAHWQQSVKVMRLPVEEFIRRFLLHVLPKGFQRIRHYGLFANRHRTKPLAACWIALDVPTPAPREPETIEAFLLRILGTDPKRCPHCGHGRLRPVKLLPSLPRATGPPFLRWAA